MGFIKRHIATGGTSTPATSYSGGSFALTLHETLVYYVSHNIGTINSVVWNGHNLTKAVELAHSTGNIQGSIWVLYDAPAETGELVTTFAASNDRLSHGFIAVLPTKDPLSTDVTQSNQGTGVTATIGTTAALTYPGELALALLSWQSAGGFTDTHVNFTLLGQAVAGGSHSVNMIHGYYLNEYGTTGIQSSANRENVDWIGLIITLKENSTNERQITKTLEIVEYTEPRVLITKTLQETEYKIPKALITKHVQIIEWSRPGEDLIAEFI